MPASRATSRKCPAPSSGAGGFIRRSHTAVPAAATSTARTPAITTGLVLACDMVVLDGPRRPRSLSKGFVGGGQDSAVGGGGVPPGVPPVPGGRFRHHGAAHEPRPRRRPPLPAGLVRHVDSAGLPPPRGQPQLGAADAAEGETLAVLVHDAYPVEGLDRLAVEGAAAGDV